MEGIDVLNSRLESLEKHGKTSEARLSVLEEQGRTSVRLLEKIAQDPSARSSSPGANLMLSQGMQAPTNSVLTFKNISFAVKGWHGKEPKRIISNASASVESGHVLAIMGVFL